MKKTLIALMALAGVAMGDSVTLETKLISGETVYGMYSQWADLYADFQGGDKSIIEQEGLYSTNQNTTSLTFYVAVSELLGGENLSSDATYTLNTLSWLGQNQGHFTGDSRTVIITNGSQTVTSSMPSSNNCYTSVTLSNTLTFAAGDILTVTFQGASDAYVAIKYIDTPGSNQIWGSSSALDADGSLNYWHDSESNNNDANGWKTTWKNDAPIVSLSATMNAPSSPSIPEPATATLSLLALAGLASRRRRH